MNSEGNICFCFDEVSGYELGDIMLRCGCYMHHDCIVQYVCSQLEDRIKLFSSMRKSNFSEMLNCVIICPFVIAGKCRSAVSTNQPWNRFTILNQSGECVSLNCSKGRIEEEINSAFGSFAANYLSLNDLKVIADFDEKFGNKFTQNLRSSDIIKIRSWMDEYFESRLCKSAPAPIGEIGDIKTEAYVNAIAKRCPSCNARGVHYQGHHCHHISPSSGCHSCGTHYCYRCLSTDKENRARSGFSWKCQCGSWSTCCGSLSSKSDCKRYLSLEPYPHDRRCGCPICPDCRPGTRCSECSGHCPVCKGLVPPGPTELSPKILLQLETDLIQSKYAAYDELLRACQRCDPDGVQQLFDQEGDALAALGIIKDRYGRTPLHFVCLGSASNRQDQLVTLEKLLRFFSQEQYINAEDYFGNTAVDVAAKSGDFHIVNRFLEAGARVTGRTLVLATEGGFTDCVKIILEAANFRAFSTVDEAINLAVQRGYSKIVSLLLQISSSALAKGSEPLFLRAAAAGHVDTAEVLLANNAQVNETDKFGYTALHKAVIGNHLDFIKKILLPRKVDLNASDYVSNETAIMKACRLGHEDIVSLLLQQDGINVIEKNHSGDTALTLCRQSLSDDLKAAIASAAVSHEDILPLCSTKEIAERQSQQVQLCQTVFGDAVVLLRALPSDASDPTCRVLVKLSSCSDPCPSQEKGEVNLEFEMGEHYPIMRDPNPRSFYSRLRILTNTSMGFKSSSFKALEDKLRLRILNGGTFYDTILDAKEWLISKTTYVIAFTNSGTNTEIRTKTMNMKSEKYLQQLDDSNSIKLGIITAKMGRDIAKARIAHGMTQAKLAARLSVSKQVIRQYEAAQVVPDINILRAISRLLHISLLTD